MIVDGFSHDFKVCKYYAPTEYNLDALFNEYFWFSKRENLNDPFDLGGFKYNSFRWLDLLLNPLEKNSLKSKLYEIKEYASCSFTDSPLNRIMWAYYANNYQGWCLVFDSDNLLKKPELLYKVNYIDEEYLDTIELESINIQELLRIKHKDWGHEQEKRIIIQRKDNEFKRDWENCILGAIIMGHKINPAYRSLIIKYCKENTNVKLYQTACGDKFNLIAQEINLQQLK